MNTVRIEFEPSTVWRRIWLAAGILLTLVVCASAWFCWRAAQSMAEAVKKDAIVKTQIAAQRQSDPNQHNTRSVSIQAAAEVLLLDLNKSFGTVEHLNLDGVRLRNFSLDQPAGNLRLEFELDSIERASQITSALNSGYNPTPWKLESVARSGSSAVPVASAPVFSFRGTWSSRLGAL